MIAKTIAALSLALILGGCASNTAVFWEQGETGGPPAAWRCQANG